MEHLFHGLQASVVTFSELAKKWVPIGNEQGLCNIQIIQNEQRTAFRIVAWRIPTQEMVLNTTIGRHFKHNKANPMFHQWRDHNSIFGVHFSTEEDSDKFGQMLQRILMHQQLHQVYAATQLQPTQYGYLGPTLRPMVAAATGRSEIYRGANAFPSPVTAQSGMMPRYVGAREPSEVSSNVSRTMEYAPSSIYGGSIASVSSLSSNHSLLSEDNHSLSSGSHYSQPLMSKTLISSPNVSKYSDNTLNSSNVPANGAIYESSRIKPDCSTGKVNTNSPSSASSQVSINKLASTNEPPSSPLPPPVASVVPPAPPPPPPLPGLLPAPQQNIETMPKFIKNDTKDQSADIYSSGVKPLKTARSQSTTAGVSNGLLAELNGVLSNNKRVVPAAIVESKPVSSSDNSSDFIAAARKALRSTPRAATLSDTVDCGSGEDQMKSENDNNKTANGDTSPIVVSANTVLSDSNDDNVSTRIDLNLLREEILEEVRKEIQRAKCEILRVIQNDLHRC